MAGYGQLGRQISTSIGRAFSPDARQAGEMAGLQQIALQDQIEQGRAKAAAAAQEAELKSPRSIIARTLMGQGIGPENAPEVGDWLDTGRIDRFDAGGQAGPTMPQPDWYKPETRTRIGQHFAGAQAVQAGEAKSLEDYFQGQTAGNLQTAIAKALASGDVVQLAQLQNKDPMKQVQSLIAQELQRGAIDPATGGRRMAATEGKPLYAANEFGSTDLFTGAVDASGAPAQAFNRYRDAATGAQRANATQSLAAADNSRASAAKSRAEMSSETGARGKLTAGYRWGPPDEEGFPTQVPIKGGPADPATKGAKLAKPPTEGQAKALMFGSRMAVADEILGELAAAGTDKPGLIKSTIQGTVGMVPWAGGTLSEKAGSVLNTVPAALGGPNAKQQQVEQARRDFINAVLRRESGAVISDSEFANAERQYFPQYGDSAEVKRQKDANRQTAIAGMKAEFGEQSLPEFESIVSSARAGRGGKASPNAAPGQASAPVRIATDADYAALPPGTRFVTPDGKTGTKR